MREYDSKLETCFVDLFLNKAITFEQCATGSTGAVIEASYYPHHPVFKILGSLGYNTAIMVAGMPELQNAKVIARDILSR